MSTELYLIAPPDAAADAFGQALLPIFGVATIAALLLPRGVRSDAGYRVFVSAVAPIAQEAGCAVLIEGAPRDALALGVDGIHLAETTPADVRTAIAAAAAAQPGLIVGVGGVTTRHDAMTLGELGPDYIMFGPLSGVTAPDIRELAGWWAETMEIPGVLSDPAAAAETADAAGCEFLALSDSVFEAADPASVVAAIAAHLGAAL
jgi:thiamine-phosphate pyrophosphorylase